MINQAVIITQLREGQEPERATVYRPQKFSLVLFILVIVSSLLLFFPMCPIFYGLIITILGNEKMIDSSLWPIYTHYPFLALPQLLLPFLWPFLVWRVEKRNRDMVLVLFPEGFIQYKPWKDEKKCQAKMVEYANIQAIVRKVRLSGIALGISYNDGTHEVVFLTTKENDSLTIREQIINDCVYFTRPHQLSREN